MRWPWLNIFGKKDLPAVRQATATECGLACIAMIATHFGAAVDLCSLRRKHPVSLKGATLINIADCCRDLELSTRAVRCGLSELRQLKLPCILHWRFNHFVVLKAVNSNSLLLHDPARGVVVEPFAEATRAFTGVALEVVPSSRFQQASAPSKLRLADLVWNDTTMSRLFAAGLLLALICEMLLLTAPFYLQIVIDRVLVTGDGLLMNTLVLAFSILLAIQIVANVMRQLTFQYLGHVTVFDLSGRVLHRLLRQPVSFFRDRELGDIQHRVQSLGRVQNFIVQSLPQLVLDLIFVVLITVLMLLYEANLTLLMISALALWGVWRLIILPRSLRMSSDIAYAESSLQTHFLETLRTMQTVKVANGESQRESEWRNLFASAINARIRASNLHVLDSALRQLLFQSVRIVTVYQLAKSGLLGEISIGMISAYVTYLGMFTTRGCGIVDRLLEYKLLDVPLGRLADIVFSDEEPSTDGACTDVVGDIEFRKASFSYSRDEPDVLRNCSALIKRGSFTAIVGPSGCGKSTLLHIIAGNEAVSGGEVLLGGKSRRQWQTQALRSQMAVVFQGDGLLKGSVAENIALFDRDFDMTHVQSAASAARIHVDIDALPMGYETRVGDLGSSLSRGQVQRLLLARAIYRRPQLLLLDEATSGLDRDLEKDVIRSLQRLPGTRIVVTHSDLMLQAADRVLWLHEGRLLSSRPDLNVWGPQ